MACETIVVNEGMGIADTEKNTEESNTNTKENIDGIPITVESPAEDAISGHYTPTSTTETRLPWKKTKAEKLWKKSNPKLPKITLKGEDIYTIHRIHSSPARWCHIGRQRQGKASDSSGRIAIASESPLRICLEEFDAVWAQLFLKKIIKEIANKRECGILYT
jgi:hypothetical protein